MGLTKGLATDIISLSLRVWILNFKKGKMMKNASVLTILGIVLCALAFLSHGCSSAQPGETVAEGHRRHLRTLRINQQELMQDIDMAMLTDKPSKLTDKRIP